MYVTNQMWFDLIWTHAAQILTLPSALLNRNRDSSDQALFFHSSIVQCWWWHAHWRPFLFLADMSGTRCVRLLQQPICGKDWRVVRSEMPFCTPLLYCTVICLFVACLVACTILAILLRPLINELFSPTGLPLTGCFLFVAPFSVNTRHCRAWDTGTGAPGPYDHTMTKVALVSLFAHSNVQSNSNWMPQCLIYIASHGHVCRSILFSWTGWFIWYTGQCISYASAASLS